MTDTTTSPNRWLDLGGCQPASPSPSPPGVLDQDLH